MDREKQGPESSGPQPELKPGDRVGQYEIVSKLNEEKRDTGFYVGYELGYENGSRDTFRASMIGISVAFIAFMIFRITE